MNVEQIRFLHCALVSCSYATQLTNSSTDRESRILSKTVLYRPLQDQLEVEKMCGVCSSDRVVEIT